jgi:hypothetical protein
MSKLGDWRASNWYWDHGWSAKDVKALRRRCWSAMKRARNARSAASKRREKRFRADFGLLGGGVTGR